MQLQMVQLFDKPVTSLSQAMKVVKATEGLKHLGKRGDDYAFDVRVLEYQAEADIRLQLNPSYYEQDSVQGVLAAIKRSILKGKKIDPISVSFLDGKPLVVGGFKKYMAACQLSQETGDSIMVDVVQVAADNLEILDSQLAKNNIDPFNKLELGVIFKSKLMAGATEQEIVEQSGYKLEEIRTCVATLGLPDNVKQLLLDKRMSFTQWEDMVREYGVTDAAVLAENVSHTSKKVTAKAIDGRITNKLSKRKVGDQALIAFKQIAPSLNNIIMEGDGTDDVLIKVSRTDYLMLQELKLLLDQV